MERDNVEIIKHCRSCLSESLVDILDLGLHPLANSLGKTRGQAYASYPLTTAFCPACGLFQLKETIRKEILFDQYVWVTGTSAGAKQYAEQFFNRVTGLKQIQKNDLIVEIASNDGTILKPFVQNGYKVLGVEPAKNIAAIAEKAGVNTLNAYWNEETAKGIIKGQGHPKVIMARNVIPHVSQLHEVISGIQIGLDDAGVGIIEFHNGGIIARELHYDSIYHEHLCYFTIGSITQLLNQHGLFPFHIDHSPISGGSFVIYFAKTRQVPTAAYVQAVEQEKKDRVNDAATWQQFAKQSLAHKNNTLELLSGLVGKTIVGFGASARSATFLNFCKIDHRHLSAVIDNNALKQGLFTPGSGIPVVSREQGLGLNPDIIFILAWNFKDEIIKECKAAGFKGEFLIPFPNAPYLI